MSTLEITDLESSLATLRLAAPLPVINSADAVTNPLDLVRSLLAGILSQLVESSPEAAYRSVQLPNSIYDGDLDIVLPKLRPGCKAGELAIDLARQFPIDHPLFPLPFLEGVHWRVLLRVNTLARLLFPFILERGNTYGTDKKVGSKDPSSPKGARKKLIVEFSSPNITNEFHGKHLRSTIIGAFLSRFYESRGWDVTRLNYLGDWGKNIALLKVGWERFADEVVFQARPIEHLLEVYDQINNLFQPEVAASRQARDEAARNGQDEGQAQTEIENQGIYAQRNTAFKKLEEGDEEAIAFWKQVRDVNIENYKDFYSQLGIEFDEYTGESQVKTETMNEVEALLKEKKICEESSGAWVIHMQNHGLKAGTAVIRGRDGATTYLLRDLAAMIERSKKYNFNKMIIVAANDHNSLHFTHLHHILIAMGMKDLAEKIQHLKFNETSSMAETLGTGFKPQAILSHVEQAMSAGLEADAAKTAMFGNLSKSADRLSVASLLVHELSTRTTSAHSFDLSAMTSFKHGTGPDLQYWYAKLCTILKTRNGDVQLSDEDYDFLGEDDSAANLLRLLAQYPEVTRATYNSTSPQPDDIVKYLAGVTEQLADCLSDDEDEVDDGVKGETEAKAEQKTFGAGHLTLFEATRIVLENGLKLLGITPYVADGHERADTPIAE
ncbi:arginyl-tRNA synthetase [Paraphaeosphaeria sporulosa]|uniref:arginine--tRNA ligase n=1 Tax=Paraphaeosphaeria sporulosa TaxID=1460663 RepID=A0A177C0W6_9PLEO|nr:arginyl-tRNA synthetase [Paraphaeosphaeria sporulosa]OAG00357.1 arginyl-tRNA synthetase [Paraphaeosphaeria sporulosa]